MTINLDPAALSALLDKQAIGELLMRYSRSMDRRDWDLARSVFWPDAADDHMLYRGSVDGFLAHAERFLVDTPTMHFLGNMLIDLESETTAFSETYYIAYHDMPKEGAREDLILWGRYLDSLERRNSEWRISARTLTLDAYTVATGTSVWDRGMFAELRTRGGAKPDDPLYHLHPRKTKA